MIDVAIVLWEFVIFWGMSIGIQLEAFSCYLNDVGVSMGYNWRSWCVERKRDAIGGFG